jgi:pyruvate/2-oxoglutarate/acetoin dehydrogenase E1 component
MARRGTSGGRRERTSSVGGRARQTKNGASSSGAGSRVLVVHEDTRTGGLAGEIIARINETSVAWLGTPVMRVTAHDIPLPYAPQLEDFVLLQARDIVRAARWVAAY